MLGSFTCVRPFVDFEVFAPGEHFAASGKGARKGFLARVDSNVIH